MIFTATLPWAAYFTLLTLGGILFYTLDHWPNLSANPPSEAVAQNDSILLWIGSSPLFLFSLYFLSLSAFSQIVLCCVGSVGLSYYFIDQCIIGSQPLLNKQLCERVAEANPDLQAIEALLKAGADPFSPDNDGNHAFHHAICPRDNHGLTLAILNKLREVSSKPTLTFADLFIAVKSLQGDSTAWRTWWAPTKAALRDPRTADKRKAFYSATESLLKHYVPYLKKFSHQITTYFRQQFCFPKDMSKISKLYQAPSDKINALFYTAPEHPMKAALLAALEGDGQVAVPAPAPNQHIDLTEDEPNLNGAPIVTNFDLHNEENLNQNDLDTLFDSLNNNNNRPNT